MNVKRVIRSFLMVVLVFGAFMFYAKGMETAEDANTSKTAISRIYDTGENATIMTIQEIKTTSTNGIEITIPIYTQFKTYLFENTLREENTYSFKFRGLDIEYEVEYKDNTAKPTVLVCKSEEFYVLQTSQYLYSSPDINASKEVLDPNTTIIIEYDLENGWVYCVSGDKRVGWLNLTTLDVEGSEYTVYKDTEYLMGVTDAKSSYLYDDVALFLNQFPNVQGIAITTYSAGSYTDDDSVSADIDYGKES